MLTEKEIAEIAKPFLHACGDHWSYVMAIEENYVEDFALAIEKAVLAKIREKNDGVI